MAPYDQFSVVEGITDQTKFPQPGTGKERFVQTGYNSSQFFFCFPKGWQRWNSLVTKYCHKGISEP